MRNVTGAQCKFPNLRLLWIEEASLRQTAYKGTKLVSKARGLRLALQLTSTGMAH